MRLLFSIAETELGWNFFFNDRLQAVGKERKKHFRSKEELIEFLKGLGIHQDKYYEREGKMKW